MLLTCNDEAIEIPIRSGEKLAEKFIVEEIRSETRRCLLDKLSTYRAAREAGVPTPNFWPATSLADIEGFALNASFPVIIKPLLSHSFRGPYGYTKYRRAENADELKRLFREASARSVDVLVMEFVPGDDSLSRSYCTYMESDGQLKIIECNGRFTAPLPLAQASGLDIAGFVYDRLTGRDPGPMPPCYGGLPCG